MKIITLKEAFDILEDCAGVITEDHVITYPNLDSLNGEGDNEWMRLSWDSDGLEFDTSFIEEDNQNVRVVGSSMFLKDEEGDEFQLTILTPQNLE